MFTDELLKSVTSSKLPLPRLLADQLSRLYAVDIPERTRQLLPAALSLDEHVPVPVEFYSQMFKVNDVSGFDVYMLFPVDVFIEWAQECKGDEFRYVVFAWDSITREFNDHVLLWGHKSKAFWLLEDQPVYAMDLPSRSLYGLAYPACLTLLPLYIVTTRFLLTRMGRVDVVQRNSVASLEVLLHEAPTTIQ